MTRKHFKEIAAMVKDLRRETNDGTVAVERVARELADFCKRHNANFDRDRFMDATR